MVLVRFTGYTVMDRAVHPADNATLTEPLSRAVERLRESIQTAKGVVVEDKLVRVSHMWADGSKQYGQHTTYEAEGEELEVLKLTVAQAGK